VNASLLAHLGSAHNVQRLFRRAFFLSCSCVVLILTNVLPAQDSKSRDARLFGQNNNGELSDTHSTWRAYGGAADGAQYSSLHQIDRSNVDKLKKVWSYQTGDDLPYAFNPLVVDDVMYVMARTNSIVALDATTGKEIWTHPTGAKTALITNRGIDYWRARIALNGACSLPPTTICRQLIHGPDKPSLTSARVAARTSARGLVAIRRR